MNEKSVDGTRADGDAPGQYRVGPKPRTAAVSVADKRVPSDYLSGKRAVTLPDDELAQRLKAICAKSLSMNHHTGRSRKAYLNVWRQQDVAEAAMCDLSDMKKIMHGFERTGMPATKQRLSQVVLRIEAGLLVKRNGSILRLAEPETPVRPTIRRSVSFDSQGRPRITALPNVPVKPLFSAIVKDWK